MNTNNEMARKAFTDWGRMAFPTFGIAIILVLGMALFQSSPDYKGGIEKKRFISLTASEWKQIEQQGGMEAVIRKGLQK